MSPERNVTVTSRVIGALLGKEDLPLLRRMLDEHPDWLRDWTRISWMAKAAYKGDIEVLEELLSRGLGVNDMGTDGETPLENAVERPDVIDWLLAHGADASIPDVMNAAAAHASAETIQKLLDAGGVLTGTAGRPPKTPYERARDLGRVEVLHLLRPPGQSFDRLTWLESYIGPTRPAPELVPLGFPVELRIAESRRCTVCCTIGLSAMELPGLDRRVEVFVRLPRGYPNTKALGVDPMWPVEWMLSCVQAAMERPVLRHLDTIGYGDPPQPLSPDVPYVGSIAVEEFDEEVAQYDDDGNMLVLLSLLPLHPEELRTAQGDPLDLIRAFVRTGLEEEPVIRAHRKCTVR